MLRGANLLELMSVSALSISEEPVKWKARFDCSVKADSLGKRKTQTTVNVVTFAKHWWHEMNLIDRLCLLWLYLQCTRGIGTCKSFDIQSLSL